MSLRFELVNCGCNATSRHNRIKGCQQLRVSSSEYFKNISLKKIIKSYSKNAQKMKKDQGKFYWDKSEVRVGHLLL